MPLRPAARYASLETERARLAASGTDLEGAVRARLVPALLEFESHWLTPEEREGLSPSLTSDLARHLLETASRSTPPRLKGLLDMHRLLAARVGGSYRSGFAHPATPGHQPPPPDRIAGSLERFFEWVSSPAFGDLHPVEQMSLTQARLIEIQPLSGFARLTVSFFSQSFLLLARHPMALYPEGGQAVFDEALDQAFVFSTEPLVDWNLTGCERA